jgi:hypothetical protein
MGFSTALPPCPSVRAFGQMAYKVDALAEKMEQSRAAVINMAVCGRWRRVTSELTGAAGSKILKNAGCHRVRRRINC